MSDNEKKISETETETEAEVKAEAKEEKQKEKPQKESREAKELKKRIEEMLAELDETKKALDEANDKYVRMLAEYDNYRRRTGEEKDAIYGNAIYDVLDKILPIIDNLERASQYDGDKVAQGVKMTLTSFKSSLEALGVTEIECKTFDPNLHNAVMHVEDENYGEGEIVEVFQKGYQKGGKIIRYAMVKTAN